MRGLFILAAFLAACSAFGHAQVLHISDFDELVGILESGGDVVLDADGSDCDSDFPFPLEEHRYISFPLRDWEYGVTLDGRRFIGANDYYVGSANGSLAVTVRDIFLREDKTVSFYIRVRVGSELTVVHMACQLGTSARAFPYERDQPIDNFYSYNQVKSALLLGRHLEVILFAEYCQGYDSSVTNLNALRYGHRIENFGVFNQATPWEYLVFYHSNLYPNYGGDADAESAWGTYAYLLYPNGTTILYYSEFLAGGTWEDQSPFQPLTCETGISAQYTSYKDQDLTLISYNTLKEATLKGHEVELIVFTETCDVISGVAPPNAIIGHRFDQFQLFRAGELWGPEEHLSFGAFAISPEGTGILDEIKVYESNRVVFDWSRFNPADGTVTKGELSCPVSSGALFHVVERDRGPSFSYVSIMRAIKNEGAIFEIEIDYSGCDLGESGVDLESIYGGITWETYIGENAAGIDEFFVAFVFGLQTDGANPDAVAPLWTTGTIVVTKDNVVQIYARVYNLGSGEDVTPGGGGVITCELNTGGPSGSVYFFRYP